MISYLLMVLMIVISLAALIYPPLADIVGGVGAVRFPWQPWTAVFLHGWPGMPLLLHLAGNLVLLALVGPPVERMLGPGRFLLVTLAAIGAAGVVRLLSGVEFNGASAFIWAYAPLLWLLIRREEDDTAAGKTGLLWVMWLIVPLALGIILVLNGAPLLTAFVWGNIYHLSATVVGFVAAWLWRKEERKN